MVSHYRKGVELDCVRALSAGDTSLRALAEFTILPNGSVYGVRVSNPKGVPGLNHCVASRVRTWQFPAARNTTRVTVPFEYPRYRLGESPL